MEGVVYIYLSPIGAENVCVCVHLYYHYYMFLFLLLLLLLLLCVCYLSSYIFLVVCMYVYVYYCYYYCIQSLDLLLCLIVLLIPLSCFLPPLFPDNPVVRIIEEGLPDNRRGNCYCHLQYSVSLVLYVSASFFFSLLNFY